MELLFAVFAFIFGAAIGSFLNVCIYRMPLNLSVNEPKRSFCPNCKTQIPWFHNLPLISWILLRGRCATCANKISIRYLGVEFLTGLLFLAVAHHLWFDQWRLIFPFWILVSLFVVATFIDIEHFIIPDEITWGGTAAGVVLAFSIPSMMGTESHVTSGLRSLIGAAAGYGALWAVVELGKKAFGKKTLKFPQKAGFSWTFMAGDAELQVGEDKQLWSETFARKTDRLLMQCPTVEIDGDKFNDVLLDFEYEHLQVGKRKWELEKVKTIRGQLTQITIPREAMGFGDVKFIAAIGAFLGWQAVVFTIMGASVLGSVIGILTIVVGKREWSAKIPFGPYLAAAAMVWIFTGPALWAWYVDKLSPPPLM